MAYRELACCEPPEKGTQYQGWTCPKCGQYWFYSYPRWRMAERESTGQ